MSKDTTEETTEQYRAALFDEDRLASRSAVFFRYTLPILDKARGDHDLIHVISYSEELPAAYRQLLIEAAERYPWIALDKRTAIDRQGKPLENFVEERFGPGTIYGVYRLDDDDILGTNYFDQVASYINHPFVGMVVSLGLGIQAFFEEETFVNPRIEYRPKIALGLLNVCKYTAEREFLVPEDISHTWLDRKNAVILDSRQVSYVHSMHTSQDTHIDRPGNDFDRRMRSYMSLPKVPADVDLEMHFPSVPFLERSDLQPSV